MLTDNLPRECVCETLEQLRAMETKGVELVLCKTYLDYFHLTDQVAVGIIGGMPDIIRAMQ